MWYAGVCNVSAHINLLDCFVVNARLRCDNAYKLPVGFPSSRNKMRSALVAVEEFIFSTDECRKFI